MPPRWDLAEPDRAEEFVRRYLTGESLRSLEAEFGLSHSGAYGVLRRFGAPCRRATRPGRRLAPAERKQVESWAREGLCLTQIAERLGVSRTPVANLLVALKIHRPKPKVKLTDELIAAIVARTASGLYPFQAAELLGVNPKVFYRHVARGKAEECGVYRRLYDAVVDLMPGSGGHRTYTIREDFFDLVDTPEKAYLLGFTATDGHVADDRLSFGLQVGDREHLETIKSLLGSDAPVCLRETGPSTVKATGRTIRATTMADVHFGSQRLASALRALGMPSHKTFVVRPWEGPPELQRFYWTGALDGDGGLGTTTAMKHTKRPVWSVHFCGNRHMVRGLADFVAVRCGISKRMTPNGNIFQLRYFGHRQAQAVARLLYEGVPWALERKRLLAEELLRTPILKQDRSRLSLEDIDRLVAEKGSWQAAAAGLGTTAHNLHQMRYTRARRARR